MGGSASIYSKNNMFGHDGHMGTQVPIGIFFTSKPTIIFMGDASAEEVCFGCSRLGCYKKLPILFIVEDNNLSILTEKK